MFSMKLLAHITDAPQFRNKSVLIASLSLAGLYIVMAVGQLFSFEKFPNLMSGYWLLGDQVAVHLVAALIVTAEVFSLPFLLRMAVSPLMRILSLVAGWYAALTWLVLGIWVVVTTNSVQNSGVLGASVRLPAGVWQIVLGLLLVGLMAYITWDQHTIFRLTHRRAK